MSNYVPNYEELHYQVHPSQLRWAMSQLGAVPGYNVLGYAPGQGGMYIIVVQVPVGTPQADWRDARPRRRWHRLDLPRLARGLAALLLVVAVLYIAYSIFVDGLPQTTSSVAQATPEPSLWDRLANAVPHGEPSVEHVKPKAIEMPWDAAGRQVGEAVEGIGRVLTVLVVLLVLGMLLWFVAKVRGALGK